MSKKKTLIISDAKRLKALGTYISESTGLPIQNIKEIKVAKKGDRLFFSTIKGSEGALTGSLFPEIAKKIALNPKVSDDEYAHFYSYVMIAFPKYDLAKMTKMAEDEHPGLKVSAIEQNRGNIKINYAVIDNPKHIVLCEYALAEPVNDITTKSYEVVLAERYNKFSKLLKEDTAFEQINKVKRQIAVLNIRESCKKQLPGKLSEMIGSTVQIVNIDSMQISVKFASCTATLLPACKGESLRAENYLVEDKSKPLRNYSIDQNQLDDDIDKFAREQFKYVFQQTITPASVQKNFEQTVFQTLDKENISKWSRLANSGILIGALKGKYWNNPEYEFDARSKELFASNVWGSCIIGPDMEVKNVQRSESYKLLESYCSKQRFQKYRQFILDEMGKYDLSNIEMTSGNGLLIGPTELQVCKGKFSVFVDCNAPSYDDPIDSWRKYIDESLDAANAQLILKMEAEEKENRKRLGSLFGSFLARDIATFVKQNDDYITPNAIYGALRTGNVQLNTYVRFTEAKQKYKYLSTEKIERVLKLMIQNNILRTKTLNGTYGSFKVVHTTDQTKDFLKKGYQSDEALEVIVESLKANKRITDAEAFRVFKAREHRYDPESQMIMAHLISVVAFASYYKNELTNYFSHADDTMFEYLKMMEDCAEDTSYKELLHRIRLDGKKAKKELMQKNEEAKS